MKKNAKGITLVAMVITIIVMLILAGVSISMVVGENGVLTKASKGSVDTQLSSIESAIGLAITSSQTDYFADVAEKAAVSGKKNQYLTLNTLNKYCDGAKLLAGTNSVKTYNVPETTKLKIEVAGKKFIDLPTEINDQTSVLAGCGITNKDGNSTTDSNASSGYKSNVLYFSDGSSSSTIGNNVYVVVVHFEGGFFKIENIGIIDSDVSGATTVKLKQGGAYSDEKSKLNNIVTWLRGDEVTMQ